LAGWPPIGLKLQVPGPHGGEGLFELASKYRVDALFALWPGFEVVALLLGVEFDQGGQRTDSLLGILADGAFAAGIFNRVRTLANLCPRGPCRVACGG